MAKRSAKVALTYVITIVATLVIIGGIGFYLLEHFVLAPREKKIEEVPIDQLVNDSEYIPVDSDKRTILLILDAEKRQTASCFMLIRFLPVEKQFVLMPLPSNTEASVDGKTDTIYEFYRNGGTKAAVSAAENCTGVTVDKYIKFTKGSFESFIDIFGGVDYFVPYNLVYSNTATGEETVIREGKVYLDSNMMRKIITYPNYTSGEEYRAKCAGVAMTDIINANVDESFSTHLDDYFNDIVNSDVETDITSYDYDAISKAIKYAIIHTDKLAKFVPVTGTESEERMTLDANFVKSLNEWFKLYDSEELENEDLLATQSEESAQ